jgi:tripartite-type tricarboxylate transporter receptor subunit TctC
LNSTRRQFLPCVASVISLPWYFRSAFAQTYPDRPVRVLVGFPAGGGTDIVARLVSQWLSERLRQPFYIENRPGAGSNIATEAALKAAPDGYTLLFSDVANAINASLYERLNFNFLRDMAPVASTNRQPQLMVVSQSFPAKTVPEFIAYTKAHPGQVNMASGGNGTPAHVGGELFKMMTGVNMTHVPYRGAPAALTDVIAGQVHVIFAGVQQSIEYVKAGKLRALAVTTATRLDGLPEVPTVGEFVPGYEVSGWQGVVVPKNTPSEIIARLNREINASLSQPLIKARFAELGLIALAGTPSDFGKFIADETEKWTNVVKFSGAKPD